MDADLLLFVGVQAAAGPSLDRDLVRRLTVQYGRGASESLQKLLS
jgi:hypothetical protein